MSSMWGRNIRISIFGESHSGAIGVVLDGLPAGISLNMQRVQSCMQRRRPMAGAAHSTQRAEADTPEILSGLFAGKTTGTPLCCIIRNSDTRSDDYEELRRKPRPSHADLTAGVKYRGFQDYRGGGHFSGRLTAPLVFAGAVAEHILDRADIRVGAYIRSIGSIEDATTANVLSEDLEKIINKPFPVLDEDAGTQMQEEIAVMQERLDSAGGIVECVADIPCGLGDPIFGGVESVIAALLFAIPAVKGVEFGDGFAISRIPGSRANDAPVIVNGKVSYKTNHNGGVLGGISNGMPLVVRTAFKPTPSIGARQETVDLDAMQNTTLHITGRHDVCIVPRAVEVVRCAVALCLADMLLEDKKYD